MNKEKSYIHPKVYAGIPNTPTSQAIQRAFMEENCLTTDGNGQRVWICRKWAKGVSLAYPGTEAKCRVE